ncbi:MAG: hypothetical protein QM503_13930 [Bacteroidota bacterium]
MRQLPIQAPKALAGTMYINNDKECVDISVQNDQPLMWQQPFNDLLDEIYYPGYADKLMDEDPESYSREYWYFMQLYD